MSQRDSPVSRDTKYWINPPHGIAYEIFRTMRGVLKEPIPDLGSAIESLQNYLVSGPQNSLPHTAALRKNWHFLQFAIRSAARDTKAPFGSLPFRVFAEYSEIASSHSAALTLRA